MENIRDKLAENIHEMWAVTKIETGWCFGERRDDAEMIHPCLTQFQNLPTAEKRYNIQLAVQTLRFDFYYIFWRPYRLIVLLRCQHCSLVRFNVKVSLYHPF